MRYIAAYLLLQIGGNASPSAADIKKVLGAGGIDVEEERLEKFLAEVKGKSIDELIAAGSSKLASVPSGGAVAASGGSAPTAGGNAPAAAEKVEEKKEEEKEESDDDMGFGLFD